MDITRLLETARSRGCQIVHISLLAGEEPAIPSDPCLGVPSAPLTDITRDGYLALMAQIRSALVVEHQETFDFTIITGGSRDRAAVDARSLHSPQLVGGYLDLAGTRIALYYMLDSAGQETTILYDGLASWAEIQDYWKERAVTGQA